MRKLSLKPDKDVMKLLGKIVTRSKLTFRSTFLEHIGFMFRFSPVFKSATYPSGAYNYEL